MECQQEWTECINIIEKITDIVPVFNITQSDKNGVSIDKNVIEQMEEEIKNTPKK